ncbi:DUF3307 domain-containing protein [Fuscovulum blasticum]|uniref:DUF3307 domain-containing protein n=1 Tax=Fuscovulum blasticum TaxID=1075 RepID=UPI000D3E43FD|nr:DUF3307 domain-containing protein [Fuscovulum blasticum]AWD20791.1 hypothetical protein B6K69_03215 [Fuscovulum blasticum]
MPETLAALLFAHVLADFVFQTAWMVRHKRRADGLALHGLVVLATAMAATGRFDPGLLWLTALHVGFDALKARSKGGLAAFMADQAAHLAVIAALAFGRPDIWAGGLWAGATALPALMAVAAGAIVATRAGGFAVGLLMGPFAARLPEAITAESLPGAGRVIGLLERGLIFALVLLGQPEGVGLLIAAKSILRFGAVRDDRALSEYVIIGTLASFGWALVVAYATLSGLAALPPLGIRAVAP